MRVLVLQREGAAYDLAVFFFRFVFCAKNTASDVLVLAHLRRGILKGVLPHCNEHVDFRYLLLSVLQGFPRNRTGAPFQLFPIQDLGLSSNTDTRDCVGNFLC